MHLKTDRLIIRDYKKKDAVGLYEILSHPPVHCFEGDKLNSLKEAEKEVEQRGKKGEHFAVCLFDTDVILPS